MVAELIPVADGSLLLRIAAGAPSTHQVSADGPDVWRYFPDGPAVFAVSVSAEEGDPEERVGAAAGDVVLAYRSRPSFRRDSREWPSVIGADVAALLDFVWEDEGGVLMHSLVLVASDATRTVVVHGAFPDVHGQQVLADTEAAVLSCQLLPPQRLDS